MLGFVVGPLMLVRSKLCSSMRKCGRLFSAAKTWSPNRANICSSVPLGELVLRALPARFSQVNTIVRVELCLRVEPSIPCSPIGFVSRLFSITWKG